MAVASPPAGVNEAVAASCVEMALNLKAPGIMVIASSGSTARFIAKYRPHCPVLVICFSEDVARQCLVHRGLFPLVIDIEVRVSCTVLSPPGLFPLAIDV